MKKKSLIYNYSLKKNFFCVCVSIISCVVVCPTRKLWSDLSVKYYWLKWRWCLAGHYLMQSYKSKMYCCYPLENVSPWPNIKKLLVLLQEHARRCLEAIFQCLLFQVSLRFIRFCCIFLIIYVNVAVMGGFRLTSGGKQGTSVLRSPKP